jgi:phosphatidylethanolamine-binding protein (PEBP) family uncharacterized protein
VNRRLLAIVVATGLLAGGCGTKRPEPPAPGAASGLTVTSSAFTDGGPIPADFTCIGARKRPPLTWTGDVKGASTLAVVVDDPDAPGGDFYHWVVVDLPPSTPGLTDAAFRDITAHTVVQGRLTGLVTH